MFFPFLIYISIELYIMKNFVYDYVDGLIVHLGKKCCKNKFCFKISMLIIIVWIFFNA